MLGGERRHAPRENAEQEQIQRRLYAAAARLARAIGGTPEELLDYRRADGALGKRQH